MTTDREVSSFHMFHRWTPWTKPEIVGYSRLALTPTEMAVARTDDGRVHWTEERQRRTCYVCGAEQERIV